MNRSFRAASLAAFSTLVLLAGASPANAQAGSHITISRCSVRPYGGNQVELSIDYTNRSAKVAQAVDFAVIRNDGLAEVRDLGQFTNGALIARRWVFSADRLPRNGPPRCEVLGVIYRNASAWANPNPPY